MARREIVQLTDDLDGSEAARTVSFAYNGAEYEIDLSEENAQEFDAMLEGYVSHARRVGGRRTRTAAVTTPTPRGSAESADPKAVREWAQGHGYSVSPRGRISREVMDAYLAAG